MMATLLQRGVKRASKELRDLQATVFALTSLWGQFRPGAAGATPGYGRVRVLRCGAAFWRPGAEARAQPGAAVEALDDEHEGRLPQPRHHLLYEHVERRLVDEAH